MNGECRLKLRRMWKGYVKRKVSGLSVLSWCVVVVVVIIISLLVSTLIVFVK